ncbi:MAG: FlgD immunoglobulin-like domain containing protein [Candidatus Cloacimonadota bacterium]|nr:FlgD immunoglobulin-like domain containing protein [Candidatus Cloacimonadota bacterium]
MKKTKRVLVVLGFLFLCSYAFAEIINVPADQPTIQQGINAAANGDTVLVQPGTYVENINYNGKSIVLGSLFLTTGNPAYITETIIDGNNINSVVIVENITGTGTALCGFTIINGHSYESAVYNRGGGISCYNSDITIENLIVSNNISDEWGGGINISEFSNVTIDDVIIKNNSGLFGGGILVTESETFLTNIKVLNNSAWGEDGGIGAIYSNVVIENSQISGNSAGIAAGGLGISSCDSFYINNVLISDNYSVGWGGGLSIYTDEDDDIRINNSVITGNSTGDCGAGIIASSCSPIFTNVTISENSCEIGGGGCWVQVAMFGIICHPTFINCIFWNNTPNEIELDPDFGPNEVTISYTDLQGGEEGIVMMNGGTVHWLEGNIDEDPLFAFAGEHQYSILEASLCINAGIPDTTGLYLPEFDLAGNPRVLDGRIEMGAYEFTTLISTDFTASYTEGAAPFTVQFTDLTSGYPTEWEWDFNNDGAIDSNDQDPVWTYEESGDYTVTLTSSNAYNEDTEIKENYIYVIAVSADEDIIPIISQLIGNYPNPFNPTTTISFSVTQNSNFVNLEVFNIKGQKVKQLVNEQLSAGEHQVIWNGKDDNGKTVTSGIYFYKMKSGSYTSTKKMILMK